MRPEFAFLPERITALSISSREIVLPQAAALEAIDLAEEHGIQLLAWEGWVRDELGRIGHGSAPQGSGDIGNLGLEGAAAFCRRTIAEEAAAWRADTRNTSEELFFCLTFDLS